jgi:hypothetical protein
MALEALKAEVAVMNRHAPRKTKKKKFPSIFPPHVFMEDITLIHDRSLINLFLFLIQLSPKGQNVKSQLPSRHRRRPKRCAILSDIDA